MERLQKPELGGGALENLGTYPVALACMVFGEMPESIKAVGNITPTGKYLVEIRTISYSDNTMFGTKWNMQEMSYVLYQRYTVKLQWLEYLWDPSSSHRGLIVAPGMEANRDSFFFLNVSYVILSILIRFVSIRRF